MKLAHPSALSSYAVHPGACISFPFLVTRSLFLFSLLVHNPQNEVLSALMQTYQILRLTTATENSVHHSNCDD